jgi:cellulose synthase/poly-beta-1,6-N-acetylglucosamine synthase-like glycosyltransferase
MKTTVSGAPSGKGAVSTWDGNSKVGAGRTEITESVAPSRITMKLDMARPFEAHNIVEYTLESKGDSTSVTWAMHGAQPILAKVVGVFIDCDKMVGKDFETGLASLKTLTEK